MPVINGFGKREGEGRESGRATILIGFPDAKRKVASRDATTGAIVFTSHPDPHQRPFTLPEVRAMQQHLQSGSEIRAFYEGAEMKLLDYIESLPAEAPARVLEKTVPLHPAHPMATVGLQKN